nr:MAG TPA: hypothetical protein [Caudoviricetes sp.]DAI49116.1 MAG TPA: hypothetical protein [Bacteriophage sp.]
MIVFNLNHISAFDCSFISVHNITFYYSIYFLFSRLK